MEPGAGLGWDGDGTGSGQVRCRACTFGFRDPGESSERLEVSVFVAQVFSGMREVPSLSLCFPTLI